MIFFGIFIASLLSSFELENACSNLFFIAEHFLAKKPSSFFSDFGFSFSLDLSNCSFIILTLSGLISYGDIILGEVGEVVSPVD